MSMPDHEGAPSGASQPSDRGGRFNVSRWALEHPALTRYLMVVLMLLGFAAYFQLGQDEDPPFTFRAMVVRTYWPGATAQQVAEQRRRLQAYLKDHQQQVRLDVVAPQAVTPVAPE